MRVVPKSGRITCRDILLGPSTNRRSLETSFSRRGEKSPKKAASVSPMPGICFFPVQTGRGPPLSVYRLEKGFFAFPRCCSLLSIMLEYFPRSFDESILNERKKKEKKEREISRFRGFEYFGDRELFLESRLFLRRGRQEKKQADA